MDVGVGLPNSIPGVEGWLLMDWARRAEALGFSTLATIGRVAYPMYEELVTLAAVAGATERIGLMTNVLLAPTRDPVLLAKEAASLDQLSGGRLVLGLGVGGRPDDYALTGRAFTDRGARFDTALELLRHAWAGEPVAGSPNPVCPRTIRDSGIPILIGGTSDATLRRVPACAGWTAGGAPPDVVAPYVERVWEVWAAAGRSGAPTISALSYFSLGDTEAASIAYLEDYYAFAGWGAQLARSIPRTPDAVRQIVGAFAAIGVDEVVFSPTVADLTQLDLLAEVVS
jgi:alkanesulfonate monooxygenase SsuD/methylene tetrahydromethanopterin reductase-like flavin-dependent oxidoreductase (luciferase family)